MARPIRIEFAGGLYHVIRTSMPGEHLDAARTGQAYEDPSRAERAFRSMKTVDLDIRPVPHWTADRVRANSHSDPEPIRTLTSNLCEPM